MCSMSILADVCGGFRAVKFKSIMEREVRGEGKWFE